MDAGAQAPNVDSRVFAAALEASPFATLVTDSHGTIQWVNEAFTTLTGYSAEEAIGQNPRMLKSGEHGEDLYQRLWATILSGKHWRGELVNRRKDGSCFIAEQTIVPVTGPDGKTTHFVSKVWDITARKKAEAEVQRLNQNLERIVAERTAQLRLSIEAQEEEIRERRHAEEVLEESEERFRLIFENAGIGVALVDVDGKPVKSNPALHKMLGYSEAELQRLTFSEFTHHDDIERDATLFRELLAGMRDRYQIEKRYIRKDGETIWGHLTVSLGQGGSGRNRYIVGIVEDITERKRIGDALRHSRQMLRSVLDHFPGVVFWKDLRGVYLGCNTAFAALAIGGRPEQVVGKTDFEMRWSRQQAEEFRDDDRYVAETGAPRIGIIEEATSENGGTEWFETSKVPLLDANGRIYGVLGTAKNISERMRTDAALRESEERYRELFDGVNDAIYVSAVTDGGEPGTFIQVNEAACLQLGYNHDEMMAMSVLDITPPESREQVRELRMQVISEGHSLIEDVHVARDGRRFPVEVNAHRIVLHGRPALLAVVRDITERKQAEQERERLIEELKDALSKVETLSGLLPICASCKKIRDDGGYWNQVEVYVAERANVQFTHSVCPECMRKLYPQFAHDDEPPAPAK
jgi:PAS domain S-box-containing protein